MSVNSKYIKQSGATLAVVLVLLLVVSVLGISAVQTSLVEEKLSGNLRDKHLAFEAAESALIVAEDWLYRELDKPKVSDSGDSGVWTLHSPGDGYWWKVNDRAWWVENAIETDGNGSQYAAPVYLIEERAESQMGESLGLGTGEEKQIKYYYQITARGYGGSENTRVHLRSTYTKRYD